MEKEKKEILSKSAASGVVALVFLILGFQTALFVVKVLERPEETAGQVQSVSLPQASGQADGSGVIARQSPDAGEGARQPQRTRLGGYSAPPSGSPKTGMKPSRKVESFEFDPNTVTLEELVRLGLSPAQAETIEHYREKGGKFRRKEDFKKMYTVSDSLYRRLEPFIRIEKKMVELNGADSAALVSLRGIGAYYANKIIEYRETLGGFVDCAQMMEIQGIDSTRFEGFAQDITVDTAAVRKLDLWHSEEAALARHPYLGQRGAGAIVRFRSVYDSTLWNPEQLRKEHVIDEKNYEKLKKYIE